jgi:periplasmic protein TonB
MSFARPQSLLSLHPDAVRIVSISAAIALNAAALLAVMRPATVAFIERLPDRQTLQIIDHPRQTPPPPPPVLEIPRPQPRVAPSTPHVVPHPVQQPPVDRVATDEGRVQPIAATPTDTPVSPPAADTAPVETTLACVAAPAPRYPRAAIQAHMRGTVTLRVLVDEQGKPLDVVVETSSGHRLLDETARQQVLDAWRFQPAQRDGRAVKAWARIPVTFDLHGQ